MIKYKKPVNWKEKDTNRDESKQNKMKNVLKWIGWNYIKQNKIRFEKENEMNLLETK